MKRTRSLIYCVIAMILSPIFSEALAFKEETHKQVNRDIAIRTVNGFSLDTYVKKNLCFADGYRQKLIGIDISGMSIEQDIRDWLGYGGEQEDRPGAISDYIAFRPTRSFNHFHNPIKQWSEAGLNDYIRIPIPAPFPPFPIIGYKKQWYTGQSSLLWSQNTQQHVGGQWSWANARTYFYDSLTLRTRKQRERNFADTFRAVGQLMHLVHDSSVPEHVRNDIHVLPSFGDNYPAYEAQVEEFRMAGDAFWTSLIINPISFDKSILGMPITNPSALVPISRIIDTNLYSGINPSITASIQSAQQTVGLSEYTNANFLSKDTMFIAFDDEPQHSFGYPRVEDLTWWIDDKKWYLRKNGNGETVNHMLRTSWLYWYRWKLFPQYKQYLPVGLDNECFKDYAQKLVPRAVGYSAGLLNYFFRGDIRLDFDTESKPGFALINNTDEKMEGEFTIYYDTVNEERWPVWKGKGWIDPKGDRASGIDFIPPSDAKEPGKYTVVFKGKIGNEEGAVAGYVNQRRLEITPPGRFVYSSVAPEAEIQKFTELSAKMRSLSSETLGVGTLQAVVKYKKSLDDAAFTYAISAAKPVSSLSSTEPKEESFDFTSNPIPLDATDVYLTVVFRGKIGEELNVVAIGERDISEPTPMEFTNNTDVVCINGAWYTSGSQAAKDAADFDKDGKPDWDIYRHDIAEAYLRVSPSNPGGYAAPDKYTFHITFLAAGDFFRGYILSDYEVTRADYVAQLRNDPDDMWIVETTPNKWPGAAMKKELELHGDQGYCQTQGGWAPCYIGIVGAPYRFRGRDTWGQMGIVFDNPEYPPGQKCSWDDLN